MCFQYRDKEVAAKIDPSERMGKLRLIITALSMNVCFLNAQVCDIEICLILSLKRCSIAQSFLFEYGFQNFQIYLWNVSLAPRENFTKINKDCRIIFTM